MSTKRVLIYAGVGVLVLYLLAPEAFADLVPSNDGGPGGPNPQAPSNPEIVPSVDGGSSHFGRETDPGFGTGSARRGTSSGPLTAEDVPDYLRNPDISYLQR